jgi:hypothetical protein
MTGDAADGPTKLLRTEGLEVVDRVGTVVGAST